MEPTDKLRFAQAMGIMGEAFQKVPSDSLTEVYWRALQDMSIEIFERATMNMLNTRTITGTFPLIAEIRAAVQVSPADMETRITIAWDKLIYAVENHGHYDTVVFDDPVIHQILKAWGGWVKWASEITNDQLKWARKDFAALYKSYLTMSLPPPEPLEGLIAQDNRNRGYLTDIPEPVYITGQTGQFMSLPYQQEFEQKRIEAK